VVKRRSLDDALTPEEQSFLDHGKQAGPVPKPPSRTKPTPKTEEPPMARAALKQELTPQPVPPPPLSSSQFTLAGAVSLNVRIEPEISTALLRASMDRKIRRLDPFTQRDIVAEALAAWLRSNGYMS
jgi:hypothetical protein